MASLNETVLYGNIHQIEMEYEEYAYRKNIISILKEFNTLACISQQEILLNFLSLHINMSVMCVSL